MARPTSGVLGDGRNRAKGGPERSNFDAQFEIEHARAGVVSLEPQRGGSAAAHSGPMKSRHHLRGAGAGGVRIGRLPRRRRFEARRPKRQKRSHWRRR